MKRNRQSLAFTLAEVLITLSIIGILAAITIPSVIANYQKRQAIEQFKKIYSELNKAVNISIIENGPISEWNMGNPEIGMDPSNMRWEDSIPDTFEFINTYLLPYLNYTQVCNYEISRTICTEVDRKDLKGITNSIYQYGAHNSSKHFMIGVKLTDGMLLWLYSLRGVIHIVVDINGDKKPNTWGKDIFEFYPDRDKNKLIVWGEGMSRNELLGKGGQESKEEGCSTSAENVAGRFCGALIQNDDWQIKDDYPW